MRYIQENLLQNEKIVLGLRPHWVIFSSGFWVIVFGLCLGFFRPSLLNVRVYNQWPAYNLLAIAFLLLGLYWLLKAYIYYATSEYAVTNKRVMIKVGWIRRSSLEIMIEKVEGILVDQTVLGRIFNYGAITIIGTGGTKDRFPFIPNPSLFRKTVQQQIDLIEQSHGQT